MSSIVNVTIANNKMDEKNFLKNYFNLTTYNNIEQELIIGNISTRFREINIEIKNIGTSNANYVDWEISVKGGIFNRLEKTSNGIIANIEPGKTGIINFKLPIGFGEISIDITIGNTIGKTIKGKIFLFLISLSPKINVKYDIIAEGFNSPIYLTNAGDGTNRLFVVDQIGKIYVIENNKLIDRPFLDIENKIVELDFTYDERGLLGLTFHPNYEENGKFYVYYSSPKSGENINHETILSEFHVSQNPNIANDESERIIFRIDQPEANHNGGQILFGPDGYLYLSLGDGGGSGDQHGSIGNGQDITAALGSIIRLDVDSGDPYAIPLDNPFVNTDGLDEIYAWGFRNPWRFSYDSESELFIVADVGQDLWEEINLMNGSGNFGWRILEATHDYDIDLANELGIDLDSLIYPIHEYSHNLGRSITGGYIYRGTENPDLYGKYVFGDWSSSFVLPKGKIFYLEETSPGNWQRFDLTNQQSFNRFILSFGEGEDKELYVLSKTKLGPTGSTGDVRKIIIE